MSLKIQYTIAMPKPSTHRFLVTLKVENWRLDASRAELVLPAWTLGSYLVREFARHIENFLILTESVASNSIARR